MNPFVGLYIFFDGVSKEKQREKEEPPYSTSLISDMLDYRGNTGSYPEMIMVKQALVESGCKVKSTMISSVQGPGEDSLTLPHYRSHKKILFSLRFHYESASSGIQ